VVQLLAAVEKVSAQTDADNSSQQESSSGVYSDAGIAALPRQVRNHVQLLEQHLRMQSARSLVDAIDGLVSYLLEELEQGSSGYGVAAAAATARQQTQQHSGIRRVTRALLSLVPYVQRVGDQQQQMAADARQQWWPTAVLHLQQNDGCLEAIQRCLWCSDLEVAGNAAELLAALLDTDLVQRTPLGIDDGQRVPQAKEEEVHRAFCRWVGGLKPLVGALKHKEPAEPKERSVGARLVGLLSSSSSSMVVKGQAVEAVAALLTKSQHEAYLCCIQAARKLRGESEGDLDYTWEPVGVLVQLVRAHVTSPKAAAAAGVVIQKLCQEKDLWQDDGFRTWVVQEYPIDLGAACISLMEVGDAVVMQKAATIVRFFMPFVAWDVQLWQNTWQSLQQLLLCNYHMDTRIVGAEVMSHLLELAQDEWGPQVSDALRSAYDGAVKTHFTFIDVEGPLRDAERNAATLLRAELRKRLRIA
jgi:hypothetical protein